MDISDLISRKGLLQDIDKEREYLKGRGQLGAEHVLVHNFMDLVYNAPSVDLSALQVNEDDVIVFKFPQDSSYDCEDLQTYQDSLIRMFPNHAIIGMPSDLGVESKSPEEVISMMETIIAKLRGDKK